METICIGNGQANQSPGDLAGSLNCMHDQQAVIMPPQVYRMTACYGGGDTAQTLDSSYYKGTGARNGTEREILAEEPVYMSDRKGHNGITEDGTATTLTEQEKDRPLIGRSIVRRLTPTECMRLQGYPDGWLEIGEERVVRRNDYETTWEETENSRLPTDEEWETDERLYDDDGNLDLSAYGFKKKRKKIGSHQETVMVWVDENGKSHEEADTAKYKAAGNSIALPWWSWLWRRIAAHYERPITMGSLFDGIGGFPLTAIQNGVKPLWASEIEAFPIAVCKKHFGDEDAGIDGDVMNFL